MRYLVSFVWANNWHQWVPIIGRMQEQHSSGVLERTVKSMDDNYWKNAKAAFFRCVGKNYCRHWTTTIGRMQEQHSSGVLAFLIRFFRKKDKKMPAIEENYDVVVVGAGHAGCEAALACARLGLETIIFTVSVDSIAMMPCNPNIGGSSKGHLVREIDALGGQMGINIDKTFIQSKMLNKSKGPAVHSLRAQADKVNYSMEMRKTLQNTEHLTIRQAEVAEIITVPVNSAVTEEDINAGKKDGQVIEVNGELQKITGVKTVSGGIYHCKAVVLCTGTYLRARCLTGEMITYTGPNGLMAANHLTDSLKEHGIEMFRFKTGTPARVDKRSLDFSKMQEQKGDERVVPFSFTTNPDDVQIDQVSCWLTYTNPKTHEIIRANLDRSPIYAGIIEGTGPRYCPSIEDKVVKFADKDRHQIFIEPEGINTNEMYVGGMSSSLPEDVQHEMYRTLPGMEHVKIVRNAYAIEYDCINPNQLYASLEFKKIKGLFSGGQFNGSSGYEEAACQGLIAGINASMSILGKEPLVLDRSEAYIGVLIDDLVTKENHEPYRMMTSRAEYRLLLRQDNADLRLTKKGYEIGLISKERYDWVCKKEELIAQEIERVAKVKIGANKKVQELLESYDSIPLNTGTFLTELIRRPELDYDKLAPIDPERPDLPAEVTEQVNISIKYDGYIKRQMKQVESFKKLEKKKIPENFNYDDVPSLRIEARQKLKTYSPTSIGQASRISGVSPADVSVLLVYMEQMKYHEKKSED
jgi:tRNA uridine 5-carboxymethylaminomethyl modification enzyme